MLPAIEVIERRGLCSWVASCGCGLWWNCLLKMKGSYDGVSVVWKKRYGEDEPNDRLAVGVFARGALLSCEGE